MFDFNRLSESLKIAILNRLSTEAKARIMCFSDCNRILEAYMAPVQETMRDPDVQEKYREQIRRIRLQAHCLAEYMIDGETVSMAQDRLRSTEETMYRDAVTFAYSRKFLSDNLALGSDGILHWTKEQISELMNPVFNSPRVSVPNVPLRVPLRLQKNTQMQKQECKVTNDGAITLSGEKRKREEDDFTIRRPGSVTKRDPEYVSEYGLIAEWIKEPKAQPPSPEKGHQKVEAEKKGL